MLTLTARRAHERLDDGGWIPTAADFPTMFTLAEMAGASHGGIRSPDELRAAYWWAWALRDARADPELAAEGLRAVHVTSFIRRGDRLGGGCHNGRAVDLVPVGITTRRLHRWFVETQLELYGELLDETFDPDDVGEYGHLHLSRYPCGMSDGKRDVLYLDPAGNWHAAYAAIEVVMALVAMGAIALLAAALLAS